MASEDEEDEPVDVSSVVSRLLKLVKRAVDDQGQPVTSLSDDVSGDVSPGSEAFQTLKKVLSAEFSDAVTMEKEIGIRQ